MSDFKQKVVFISGASRGIGRAIALRMAKESADIVIAAKTAQAHPNLPGTIYTVAEEVERLGGRALPIVLDVRDSDAIQTAVKKAADHFGGIDMLINNASAINISSTLETSMKRFDLMMSVNMRATFACSQACIPYLKQARNPHILTLSPPLDMNKKWFKDHLPYTLSKYGMSMCTLGLAEEFKSAGIAVNSLWPKTTIATSAIKVHFPDAIYQASRHPSIVADAAYIIVSSDAREHTGHFYLDEEVLRAQGVEDFSAYAVNPGVPLYTDLFLEPQETVHE